MVRVSIRNYAKKVAKAYPRTKCPECDGREYVTLPTSNGVVLRFQDGGIVTGWDIFPCPTCRPDQWEKK